jgi:hypothetical protein
VKANISRLNKLGGGLIVEIQVFPADHLMTFRQADRRGLDRSCNRTRPADHDLPNLREGKEAVIQQSARLCDRSP